MPHQANGLRPASVFGGVIMSMVDRCAALSAIRHGGGQATTLSIDRVLFKEPIRTGELVEMRSRVVHVGKTSMSIKVDVFAEHIASGTRRHTNECWLTFVHIDEDGPPDARAAARAGNAGGPPVARHRRPPPRAVAGRTRTRLKPA